MARVSADVGWAAPGQIMGDRRVDEFDPACTAASAGVVGEEGSGGDQSSSDSRSHWLLDERPSLQIACHEKAFMTSRMETTLRVSGGIVGHRLHDFRK